MAGAVVFFMAYPRPIRFWERPFSTVRADSDSLRARDDGVDLAYGVHNLNSAFYEHLTLALRRTLSVGLWLTSMRVCMYVWRRFLTVSAYMCVCM